MHRASKRLMVILSILALVVAACGGGGDASSDSTGEPSGQSSNDDNGSSAEEPVDQDTGGSEPEAPGERSATISVDGERQIYALDDVVFSQVEGMDDLTFETCSPDFFGSGRFYAIGYAVDADGEVLVGDDGGPAGTFTMDLPPDDWEATQRDAPGFEIQINDLDIEIASPEEAAGGTMAWTLTDTTAEGMAVFVDFDNTYTVEFDLVCEGGPTVNVDDLPTDDGGDDDGDSGGGSGGFPLAGAGSGSFTADGESFENVDVYSCEPFSFGSQEAHPDDVSLLGFQGGLSGLEVELSISDGFDMSDGSQFEQTHLSVFYSESGDDGLMQFEGSASNTASGDWVINDPETFEEIPLSEVPVVREASRISGSLAGLMQTWPDEGAATVDVTWDFEIPSEINEEC